MQPTLVEEIMEGTQGCCVTCGFLSKRAAFGQGSSTYFEVEFLDRTKGRVFEHAPTGVKAIPTSPFCFRLAFSLAREVEEEQKRDGKTREEAARKILYWKRDCSQWFRYQPGLSPINHLGGLAMQQTEQRQYKFQEGMEERRRQWEQQVEDHRRKFDIKLMAIVAILAAAGVVAPIFIAILSR
jgi:hypothetical protein